MAFSSFFLGSQFERKIFRPKPTARAHADAHAVPWVASTAAITPAIIPVVSFFRPIFGVGSSITLMFQAFVCARIGMDYCRTDRDKMIAGVMEEPTPKIGRKKLTTGMISTLKNVAIRKDAIPPIRDFIAFFPSL